MFITPCPICGRKPKIKECVSYTDKRRRICGCPNYDGVIPGANGFNQSFFVYIGEGDNNDIYKLWNTAIDNYNVNKGKSWYSRKNSTWRNDSHIERD